MKAREQIEIFGRITWPIPIMGVAYYFGISLGVWLFGALLVRNIIIQTRAAAGQSIKKKLARIDWGKPWINANVLQAIRSASDSAQLSLLYSAGGLATLLYAQFLLNRGLDIDVSRIASWERKVFEIREIVSSILSLEITFCLLMLGVIVWLITLKANPLIWIGNVYKAIGIAATALGAACSFTFVTYASNAVAADSERQHLAAAFRRTELELVNARRQLSAAGWLAQEIWQIENRRRYARDLGIIVTRVREACTGAREDFLATRETWSQDQLARDLMAIEHQENGNYHSWRGRQLSMHQRSLATATNPDYCPLRGANFLLGRAVMRGWSDWRPNADPVPMLESAREWGMSEGDADWLNRWRHLHGLNFGEAFEALTERRSEVQRTHHAANALRNLSSSMLAQSSGISAEGFWDLLVSAMIDATAERMVATAEDLVSVRWNTLVSNPIHNVLEPIAPNAIQSSLEGPAEPFPGRPADGTKLQNLSELASSDLGPDAARNIDRVAAEVNRRLEAELAEDTHRAVVARIGRLNVQHHQQRWRRSFLRALRRAI
ncbi:hypothetical protein [Maricaulis sp.]|uniref:hypothetical protein n=1 Tax=Maricaulis sp. TaxID=1486257 RepID=UPI003A932A46